MTARTHVRVARQLAYLPVVDEAFARGELSELSAEGLVFRDPSGKALSLPELPIVHDPRRELDALLRESRLTPGGLKCLDGNREDRPGEVVQERRGLVQACPSDFMSPQATRPAKRATEKRNYEFHSAANGFIHGVERGQMKGPLAPAAHFSQVSSPPWWLMPDGTYALSPSSREPAPS